MEEKKKVGRPSKSLKRRLTIMLTDEEFELLKKRCVNYRISAFVRYTLKNALK